MNMQIGPIEEYSPSLVSVGDIFEVSIPLYNLRIGTLVIAYHLDENGIYLLSEKMLFFYMGYRQKSWNSLKFVQRSGLDYEYTYETFTSDVYKKYFKMLFVRFKNLDKTN